MRSYGGMLSNAGPGSSPASWLFAALVLAIHAAVGMAGGPDEVPWWFHTFALGREGFLSGKFWQIFTYAFLHGSWAHVGVNALCIVLLGSRVERTVGARAVATAVFLGVAGGGLAHLALGTSAKDPTLLVGFSGACVALLLLVTTLSPESRMWPIPVSGGNLGAGILIGELLLALANPGIRIPGFSVAGAFLVEHGMGGWFVIGHACHFGGGVAGWLFGRWLLRPRVTLDRLRRERRKSEAENGRSIKERRYPID